LPGLSTPRGLLWDSSDSYPTPSLFPGDMYIHINARDHQAVFVSATKVE